MLLEDFYKPFYCPLHPMKQMICKEIFEKVLNVPVKVQVLNRFSQELLNI